MYSYGNMRLYSVDLIMTLEPVNYHYKGCVDSTKPPPSRLEQKQFISPLLSFFQTQFLPFCTNLRHPGVFPLCFPLDAIHVPHALSWMSLGAASGVMADGC